MPGALRGGVARDQESVRLIADEAFSVFGEYGSWLPGYLAHPGVWSWVWEVDGEIVGFAMLGVIEPDEAGAGRLADLLAIAVRSSHRGLGGGKALLDRVGEKGRELKSLLDVREVRLTVAEPNLRARAMFERFGFVAVPGDHGFYDKGQRALRLAFVL
jgi:ribosomal protein S18 acetylase RimI-like enzyme